ncbi:hypothetical protein K504DRAFT_369490 [Pleomassaria siparia CBS 279.74]|uniref:Uncharacterized protein n=1 Tax=Pleomassaria siparia CBS 279.74 TaxID=1314801 RepID=A0A6G1KKZ0_9PLEO|nr:hypothetical protein K504DRAFT_369490 [Pleomassaria siparia CBS 279.74]
MALSFLTGMCLALGQHMLYRSLHHKAENNELTKVRVVLYGRALAYLSNCAFVGCVILCYRQRIWSTFRERALSVWTIDQVFLATEDPSIFLNWEAITKASLVTAIAVVIWLTPVATIIFSPGALTFGDYFESTLTNSHVPTLDFTQESNKDWRVPTYLPDGTAKRSMVYYNTTDIAGTSPGFFDYYDQPSADINRIALMNAYSLKDSSLNRENARLKSCGGNFNCTYTIDFLGPGYNCETLAKGSGDNAKLNEAGSPFDTSHLVPEGSEIYYAKVDYGEFERPQSGNLSAGGVPVGPVANDFGCFKTEPVLWIGVSINSTEKIADDSPFKTAWTHRFDPYIFRCEHHETKYTVKFNYSGPFYDADISYEFLAPIINTTLENVHDGDTFSADAIPHSGYIDPRVDVPLYRKTSAYHAMGQVLRTFLGGEMELTPPIPGPSYTRVDSKISNTRLVSNITGDPLPNLSELIPDFYAKMILSILSTPQMVIISEDFAEVNSTRYRSTFIYNPEKLWACYAPVILFVFIILLIGAWTIWQDGTTFSVGFSRVMVTTRNTTLDDISRGACLGNDPFPGELMHTKLKFGVLNEDNGAEYTFIEGTSGIGHCAFGVASELTAIRKGVPYAGLYPAKKVTATKKEKAN